jgi:thiosulfate reductase cytochrome b subunit
VGSLGKVLIVVGLVIVAVGLLLSFAGKIPWIGRLPGDFYYKGERVTFYFPLATCLLISIVVSVLLYLLRR